jgi:trans-aconitate methyltransferase
VTGEGLGSWLSEDYVAEWVGDDVLADMLTLPRRISAALVADSGLQVSRVADLGSGHGPYLELLLDTFPQASGTWVDSSAAMLEQALAGLARFGDRIEYVLRDLEEIGEADVPPCEVVVSSRVLHHFSPESLQRFYRTAHELVVPGGFFFNLDHVGASAGWEQRYRSIRDQFTGARKRSLQRHRHDYPLSLADDHQRWLAEAGFEAPDLPWRTFYTVLVAARRPATRRAESASPR